MRTCSVKGCENKYWGKGFCRIHYRKWIRYNNPLGSRQIRICKIEGCELKHWARGYCNKHYNRLRRQGDPLIVLGEKHGKYGTPEYHTWNQMIQRCYNKNHIAYKYYGKRGITVCDRWKNSFTAFFKDMGTKPFQGAEIDRINNDGDYEPGNCRWTTHKINSRNSRWPKLSLEKAEKIRKLYATGMYTPIELSDKYNVCPVTIRNVIRRKIWI